MAVYETKASPLLCDDQYVSGMIASGAFSQGKCSLGKVSKGRDELTSQQGTWIDETCSSPPSRGTQRSPGEVPHQMQSAPNGMLIWLPQEWLTNDTWWPWLWLGCYHVKNMGKRRRPCGHFWIALQNVHFRGFCVRVDVSVLVFYFVHACVAGKETKAWDHKMNGNVAFSRFPSW